MKRLRNETRDLDKMPTGVYPRTEKHRNIMSKAALNPITRTKRSAIMRELWRDTEYRTKLTKGRRGRPVKEETKRKLSDSLKRFNALSGRVPWNKGIAAPNKGIKRSKESKAKISAAQVGRKASDETRTKISEAHKRRHNECIANNHDTCSCVCHFQPQTPSTLSWKMIDFLVDANFDIIIPEERFGPYTVDALLAEEWLAFEADGVYWHSREREQRCDPIRDEYLLRQFGLPAVRLGEDEINEAHKEKMRR